MHPAIQKLRSLAASQVRCDGGSGGAIFWWFLKGFGVFGGCMLLFGGFGENEVSIKGMTTMPSSISLTTFGTALISFPAIRHVCESRG